MVLEKFLSDPDAPVVGYTWVAETPTAEAPSGVVKRALAGGAVEILGPVPVGTADELAIPGPALADIQGKRTLVVDGPAVDLGDQGVAFRVECGGQG